MKITVMTADEQFLALDVDRDESVDCSLFIFNHTVLIWILSQLVKALMR